MKIKLTYDTDNTCGLVEMVKSLQEDGFEEKLGEEDYGAGVAAFCCCVRSLPHSYQKQHPKIMNGTIYVPIDLDYEEFTAASQAERKKILGTRINDKVRQALSRLALPATFNSASFVSHHKSFLQRRGWI